MSRHSYMGATQQTDPNAPGYCAPPSYSTGNEELRMAHFDERLANTERANQMMTEHLNNFVSCLPGVCTPSRQGVFTRRTEVVTRPASVPTEMPQPLHMPVPELIPQPEHVSVFSRRDAKVQSEMAAFLARPEAERQEIINRALAQADFVSSEIDRIEQKTIDNARSFWEVRSEKS